MMSKGSCYSQYVMHSQEVDALQVDLKCTTQTNTRLYSLNIYQYVTREFIENLVAKLRER